MREHSLQMADCQTEMLKLWWLRNLQNATSIDESEWPSIILKFTRIFQAAV